MIGKAQGTGPMWHATYCGPDTRLRGQGALIMRLKVPAPEQRASDIGRVAAQFDSLSTGLAYGWHRFPKHHFVVRP